jgi:hypothetical protein
MPEAKPGSPETTGPHASAVTKLANLLQRIASSSTMSASGQTRSSGDVCSMSGLPPKADVGEEGASPYTFNAIIAPALRRERGGWSVRAEK